jgi:prophage regulatory protein
MSPVLVPEVLVPYDALKAKGITFSKMHIWRLEKADKFPMHVQVSAQRIAWVESEIDQWIAARIAARPTTRREPVCFCQGADGAHFPHALRI